MDPRGRPRGFIVPVSLCSHRSRPVCPDRDACGPVGFLFWMFYRAICLRAVGRDQQRGTRSPLRVLSNLAPKALAIRQSLSSYARSFLIAARERLLTEYMFRDNRGRRWHLS